MSDTTDPRGSTNAGNGDRVDDSVPADRAVPLARPDDNRPAAHDHDRTDREVVVDREKEEFGGFKWGSAFFGWLTATGTAVLLTAILSAVGAGVGLGTNNGDVNDAAENVTKNGDVVGIVGAIALAVILLVAYYCGGYVAGRMARFAGVKQGIAVWIWAVVIAVVVAIVAAIAGSQFNILGQLNSFPRIPIDEGTLTVTGIVTVAIVAVISLVGAILGGLAGMRYHRKVDRVGLGK
ncbi:hypothetical protein [Curtobacterium sp. MCSS17_005]|uniref:hypothetical protein n=1 Tax=Curtobacterium sp. MCSS17_005 TaxID=2175641 RepID=UPI000DAA92A9|nr:hypothetical protein [Curtobacterium sp. MCSS17_005]WIB34348.1 hypothetical protein DEJ20_07745 [Curtobacterium sp. MCSS17_005]